MRWRCFAWNGTTKFGSIRVCDIGCECPRVLGTLQLSIYAFLLPIGGRETWAVAPERHHRAQRDSQYSRTNLEHSVIILPWECHVVGERLPSSSRLSAGQRLSDVLRRICRLHVEKKGPQSLCHAQRQCRISALQARWPTARRTESLYKPSRIVALA